MPKFKIEVKETLSRIVEVEAKSEDDAMEIAQNQYNAEEIVLDYADFSEVEFSNHQ